MINGSKGPGVVRIGPAGWSYADWEGVVYPSRKDQDFDQLAYLAQYFEVIEINSTFYRPPSVRNSIQWLKRTAFNPDFRFTVKLYRSFTHRTDALTLEEENQWRDGLEPILAAGRLGAVLAQFPYSFHYNQENCDHLYGLKQKFGGHPLVLEVRHRSWDQARTFDFLRDLEIGFCNVDQPQVSYSLPPTVRVTSGVAYVRLHGRNAQNWFRDGSGRDERYDYLYDSAELKEWITRIEKLRKEAREVYVIANNHYRGQAVCNSLELKAGLEKKRVPVPASMLPLYPRLAKIKGRGNNGA